MKLNSSPLPTLSLQRRHEITACAESIALHRFPDAQVDPEAIAAQEGIVILYTDLPRPVDGLLVHENGRYTIVGNERRAPRGSPRSRFTLAHELAHYFLADHHPALATGTLAARTPHPGHPGRRFEHEADIFAASLLMPAEPFRELAISTGEGGLDLVVELADLFGTSLTATAYRALELDFFHVPSAVFLWDHAGAPAGRRISPATLGLGPEYCGLADLLPTESITAGAIRNRRWGQHRGRSHLMNWFTALDGYDPRHQVLVSEEVKSLGAHGWMTLVHAAET
ncbi:MAG: ImmA/IrrE family metallo-endopeptidase [Opitutaceae bacterium]|nr:ImmA/IrrE family metallo-endopeptidase [Opitutaceae bacterium]